MVGRVILVKEFLNSLFLTHRLTHFLMRIIGTIIIKKNNIFSKHINKGLIFKMF